MGHNEGLAANWKPRQAFGADRASNEGTLRGNDPNVGRYNPDPSRIPGPEAYRRDVPNAEVHVLDAGHLAFDTAADEIAVLVREFVGSFR